MPLFHSSTVINIFYYAKGTQGAHHMCNSGICLNTVGINQFRHRMHTQHALHSKRSLITWRLFFFFLLFLVWHSSHPAVLVCLGSPVSHTPPGNTERKREVRFHWLRAHSSIHLEIVAALMTECCNSVHISTCRHLPNIFNAVFSCPCRVSTRILQ